MCGSQQLPVGRSVLRSVVYLLLSIDVLSVPLSPLKDSCEQVVVTHANVPAADAAVALNTYLTVLDERGGGEEALSKLVTSRSMTSRLVDVLGAPSWDIFVMGDAFSYSIHCARYVELAGYSWNVLLCQPRADHETGQMAASDVARRSCQPPHVMRHDNGTLMIEPTTWASSIADGSFNVELGFHKRSGETPEERGSPRLQALASMATDLLRGLPPEHAGPAMAHQIRRRVEMLWEPDDVWNVIVEARNERSGFPNWLEDAKEHFQMEIQLGEVGFFDVIVFRRECWLPEAGTTLS